MHTTQQPTNQPTNTMKVTTIAHDVSHQPRVYAIGDDEIGNIADMYKLPPTWEDTPTLITETLRDEFEEINTSDHVKWSDYSPNELMGEVFKEDESLILAMAMRLYSTAYMPQDFTNVLARALEEFAKFTSTEVNGHSQNDWAYILIPKGGEGSIDIEEVKDHIFG